MNLFLIFFLLFKGISTEPFAIESTLKISFLHERTNEPLVFPNNEFRITTINVYYQYNVKVHINDDHLPYSEKIYLSKKEALSNFEAFTVIDGERKKLNIKSVKTKIPGDSTTREYNFPILPQGSTVELAYKIKSAELKSLRNCCPSANKNLYNIAVEADIPSFIKYKMDFLAKSGIQTKVGNFKILTSILPKEGYENYPSTVFIWSINVIENDCQNITLETLNIPRLIGTNAEELLNN